MLKTEVLGMLQAAGYVRAVVTLGNGAIQGCEGVRLSNGRTENIGAGALRDALTQPLLKRCVASKVGHVVAFDVARRFIGLHESRTIADAERATEGTRP